jgi:hypothetical protein
MEKLQSGTLTVKTGGRKQIAEEKKNENETIA